MHTKPPIPALGLALALCLALAAPARAAPQLGDPAITGAVEDELLRDPAVTLDEVYVETREGVVTLTGTVRNLLAAERAAAIARTVKGVRSVVNQLRVRPRPGRSDQAIKEDVERALLMNPATEAFDLNVAVADHRVTLTGVVQSWQERLLAGRVAKGVSGVTGLDNLAEVRHPAERPDQAIKQDIAQRLRWDVLVDHALIEVAVTGGRVELSGVAGSAAERQRAVLDAYVAGVEAVSAEHLEVRYWARDPRLREGKYQVKSDDEIRRAVADALAYDPRVPAGEVTVSVSGGVVTLRGAVPGADAKRAAAADARHTVGVLGVNNRLRAAGEPGLSDRELAGRVEAALAREPRVDAGGITVAAENGVVALAGAVDTYRDKMLADRAAAQVRGVTSVENNLEVGDAYRRHYYDPYVDESYIYAYDWYQPRPGRSRVGDDKIAEAIRDELWWSPFVDAGQVTVTVKDGEAVLTGTVDSYSERAAARENALEGGATWVDNRLRVEGG
jgi:osmotically-inducible protein OsmY